MKQKRNNEWTRAAYAQYFRTVTAQWWRFWTSKWWKCQKITDRPKSKAKTTNAKHDALKATDTVHKEAGKYIDVALWLYRNNQGKQILIGKTQFRVWAGRGQVSDKQTWVWSILLVRDRWWSGNLRTAANRGIQTCDRGTSNRSKPGELYRQTVTDY